MSVPGRELAEEEVKKYIYRNLAMFHRVQVRQMIHLPCLTDTDRQKICASCANDGNNDSIFLFFQRLCCREGWVQLFVDELRKQNMGELADRLEALYRSRLLPPRNTPPPAANRPSAPPLQPEANKQSRPVEQARTWSRPRLAAPSANLPPQDTGDYRTPVQENSHLAEKTELAVHPKATERGAESDFSSTSDVRSASNIGTAIRGDEAVESPEPYPVKESVPPPVKEEPRPSQTISTSAEDSVEQKWDGRQHRPVTVKNGCFGNAHHPEESGTGSALPASASSNQPEEDYYSSDSGLLPLSGPREVSVAERKVHVLRGDQKRENPPAAGSLQSRQDAPTKTLPAYAISPEEQTLTFMDPSARRAPASDTQRVMSFTQTGTKPSLPVPYPAPQPPMHLPPSDLDGSPSVERKAPKPRQEVSATGGNRPSDGFKLPDTGALAGRPQWGMETRPSAVEDHKRDSRIFYSNCTENDMPSKPGVLSSDYPEELCSDGPGETGNLYSGSSERLRMSNSDSTSVSASDSDPILISKSSLVSHSSMSATRERNRPSGAVDATLPPEVDAGEEDTSFRSHHLLVEENRSMDLMWVPPERASSPPSLDSTSDGKAENKANDQQEGPSPLYEEGNSDSWILFAGFGLALLACAAYMLYKKK